MFSTYKNKVIECDSLCSKWQTKGSVLKLKLVKFFELKNILITFKETSSFASHEFLKA